MRRTSLTQQLRSPARVRVVPSLEQARQISRGVIARLGGAPLVRSSLPGKGPPRPLESIHSHSGVRGIVRVSSSTSYCVF